MNSVCVYIYMCIRIHTLNLMSMSARCMKILLKQWMLSQIGSTQQVLDQLPRYWINSPGIGSTPQVLDQLPRYWINSPGRSVVVVDHLVMLSTTTPKRHQRSHSPG